MESHVSYDFKWNDIVNEHLLVKPLRAGPQGILSFSGSGTTRTTAFGWRRPSAIGRWREWLAQWHDDRDIKAAVAESSKHIGSDGWRSPVQP